MGGLLDQICPYNQTQKQNDEFQCTQKLEEGGLKTPLLGSHELYDILIVKFGYVIFYLYLLCLAHYAHILIMPI